MMALCAGARLADACNLVRTDIAETRNKLTVLRGHCDSVGRDQDTIEKTRVQCGVHARNDAEVVAKRQRLAVRRLNVLLDADDCFDLMRLPSNHFETLGGDRKGQFSIFINVQWRL